MLQHGTAWCCLVTHTTRNLCYSIGLHDTAWSCRKLHRTPWYSMVLHDTSWYCRVLHGTTLNCMILHSTLLQSMILHFTIGYQVETCSTMKYTATPRSYGMVLHVIAWDCMIRNDTSWYCMLLHEGKPACNFMYKATGQVSGWLFPPFRYYTVKIQNRADGTNVQ
jgi:hypothetical protein